MKAEGETASGKSALRARMLQQLQTMTSDDRIQRSEKMCVRVFESPAWRNTQSVLLFSSLRTEPQIAALETAAVAEGKSTFIIPQTLRVESQLHLPFTPELVLVPGLAFSHSGHRLGRGVETIPIEPHDAIMNAVISD